MNSMQSETSRTESIRTTHGLVVGFWGVRYQVRDVQRAIAFYTRIEDPDGNPIELFEPARS